MSAGIAVGAPVSLERGPLLAVATLAEGVWSLAVRLVHPSAGRTVV
jgi:hypothetical protein